MEDWNYEGYTNAIGLMGRGWKNLELCPRLYTADRNEPKLTAALQQGEHLQPLSLHTLPLLASFVTEPLVVIPCHLAKHDINFCISYHNVLGGSEYEYSFTVMQTHVLS